MKAIKTAWEQWVFRSQIEKRADFYRVLADFMSDGVPLYTALKVRHARFIKPRGWLRSTDSRGAVTSVLVREVGKGRPFSQAIQGWATPIEASLIAAGEKSGDLERGLYEAAFISASISEIRSTVLGALFYPLFLLGMLGALIAIASTKLLPLLLGIVPIEQWAGVSYAYYLFIDLISTHGGLLAVGFGLLALFTAVAVPRLPRGRLRQILDGTAIFGLYRTINGAGFLLALSAQLQSKVALYTAIRKIRELSSPWARSHCQEMLVRLGRGGNIATALDTGYFNIDVMDMVFAYAELASFSEAIERIAKRQVGSTLVKVKKFSAALTAIMLVCVGGMLVWTLLAFGEILLLVGDVFTESY